MRHANFAVVEAGANGVYIRDLGPWDEHPTVTNDAKDVVELLIRSKILPLSGRLFCFDSEDHLDELLVKDGRFGGFVLGPQWPAIPPPEPWPEPARPVEEMFTFGVGVDAAALRLGEMNAALQTTTLGQFARAGRALRELIADVAALLHVAAVLEWLSRLLRKKAQRLNGEGR
jgi:hypothetical protein